MELIQLVAENLPERTKSRVGYSILICILAFALRGEISQAKLTKVAHELGQLLPGIGEQINRIDIATTWWNFGSLVNDSNVGSIFARWLSFLQAPAIRLRVIIAQATGSGLTALDVIARAVFEHPKIPWHILMRLYPEEWGNTVDALHRVGDNPYYGYREDLQYVRSTRYKSLSWVCGRLLILGGDKTLGEYKGFQEDRRNRELLEQAMHAYLQSTGIPDIHTDPTAEEYAAFPALYEVMRHANTGLMANLNTQQFEPYQTGLSGLESGFGDCHTSHSRASTPPNLDVARIDPGATGRTFDDDDDPEPTPIPTSPGEALQEDLPPSPPAAGEDV